jgi:hypothetical protein
MKISDTSKTEFSLHATMKLDLLNRHGFIISKDEILNILKNPDKIDRGYKNRYIAQKIKDEKHVIRIVFELNDENNISIITMYPGRRDRYE